MNNGISFNEYYYASSYSDLSEFQLYYIDFLDSASMPSYFKPVKLNGEVVFANVEIVDSGEYVIDNNEENEEYEFINKMERLFIDL